MLDDNLEDEVMVLSDESRNDLKDYIANALSSATVSTKNFANWQLNLKNN